VLVLYRVIFAILLMTPYVLLRNRTELRQMKRRDLLLCACSGVFWGLQCSAYFESLQFTSIAVAAVLTNMEAIFVALGSGVFLRARLSGKAWTAMLIAFVGSALVAMADISGGGSVKGNVLALVAAVMGAACTLVSTVCRRGGISTPVYTYVFHSAAALTVLLLALASGLPLTGYAPVNLATTLGMAVCCTLMGQSVYGWGLKYLSASFVATAKLVEPVFAAVWGILLFSEWPAPLVVIGSAVVILGVAMYSRMTEEGRE